MVIPTMATRAPMDKWVGQVTVMGTVLAVRIVRERTLTRGVAVAMLETLATMVMLCLCLGILSD